MPLFDFSLHSVTYTFISCHSDFALAESLSPSLTVVFPQSPLARQCMFQDRTQALSALLTCCLLVDLMEAVDW
jgi:hypothetical protein